VVNLLENDLLLYIARRDTNPDQLRSLLSTSMDWDYIIATAYAHGLLPLLHKHLSSAPTNVLSLLKRESVANTQNVLHLVGKQLKIYKLFKENDIPLALFKGPLLAHMAYGEMSLRQAGDIDLLINRSDFAQARELLESLGYEMTPRLTPAQLTSHLNNHCEIQFMRDEWLTVVDLHWDLAPRSFVFGLKADEVMSRLQSVSLAGTTVETFNATPPFKENTNATAHEPVFQRERTLPRCDGPCRLAGRRATQCQRANTQGWGSRSRERKKAARREGKNQSQPNTNWR